MTPTAQGDNYTLYHGDCLDILPTLAAGSVDAVITDPPYGIGQGSGMGGGGVSGLAPRNPTAYANGQWDRVRPSKRCFDLIFNLDALCIIFGGNYFTDMPPGNPREG